MSEFITKDNQIIDEDSALDIIKQAINNKTIGTIPITIRQGEDKGGWLGFSDPTTAIGNLISSNDCALFKASRRLYKRCIY